MARHQLQYQDTNTRNPDVWEDCVSDPYSNTVGPATKSLAEHQMYELQRQYPETVRYRIVKLMRS